MTAYKAYRKGNILFAAFMITMIFTVIMPVIAAAVDYDALPSEVIEQIEVKTGVSIFTRKLSYAVLCFLAKGASSIENSINIILHFNITDILKGIGLDDGSGYGLSKPLVITIFTIFFIIGACMLIIFRSKIKLNDFFIGILTSAAMIIALPLLISSFESLRSGGMMDIEKIDTSSVVSQNDSDVYYTVGDDILSSSICVVSLSANNGRRTSYLEDGGRISGSVFSIDILSVLSNSDGDFDKAVESVTPYTLTEQREYMELTTRDKFKLLGLAYEYDRYIAAAEQGASEVVIWRSARNTAEEMAQQGSGVSGDISIPFAQFEEQLIHDMCEAIAANSSEMNTIQAMSKAMEAQNSNPSQNAVESSINAFDDDLRKLLREENAIIYRIQQSASHANYQFRDLITQRDYDDMGEWDSLKHLVSTTGQPVEYIYRYNYDFLETFAILLALVLALVFAGLKIASVIYDLVFMQLIAGVVIATDQRNSGRAKKMVQELLNSYLIFLLCALMIKIFLSLSLYVVTQSYGTFVKLILIIGFAKATVDAPDIIVKIIGTDAGVKSGAGTAMAVMGGFRTLSDTGRIAEAAARPLTAPVTGIGRRVGSTISGGVSGAATGAVSGARNVASSVSEEMRNEGYGRAASTAVGAAGGAFGAFAGAIGGAVSGAGKGFLNLNQAPSHRGTGFDVPPQTQGSGTAASPGPESSAERSSSGDSQQRTDSRTHAETPSTPIRGERGASGPRGEKGDRGNDGAAGENSGGRSEAPQTANTSAASDTKAAQDSPERTGTDAFSRDSSRADAPEGGNK